MKRCQCGIDWLCSFYFQHIYQSWTCRHSLFGLDPGKITSSNVPPDYHILLRTADANCIMHTIIRMYSQARDIAEEALIFNHILVHMPLTILVLHIISQHLAHAIIKIAHNFFTNFRYQFILPCESHKHPRPIC